MSSDRASATKYGGLIGSNWSWSIEHGVNVSDHVQERWDERTPGDAVSPEHAWENGIQVPKKFLAVFTGEANNWQKPDEVRTFREDENTCSKRYQVCLVVRNDNIVTVLSFGELTLPERAYLRELWFCRQGRRGGGKGRDA